MKGLRGELPEHYMYKLDPTVKSKILQQMTGLSVRGFMVDDIDELVLALQRQYGESISQKSDSRDKLWDYMGRCSDDRFLAAIELYCLIKFNNIESQMPMSQPQSVERLTEFINNTNKIFALDKIGYEIVLVGLDEMPYIVVPFNSQYLYLETIKKPRELMNDLRFDGALHEFNKALDHYRKEDYENAIVWATKAYESALKTLLDLEHKTYNKNDSTVGYLVKQVQTQLNLFDPSMAAIFEPVWGVLRTGPSNIRNMPAAAHGQGKDVKGFQKSYSKLVLHLVGAYILFLIERYNESKG